MSIVKVICKECYIEKYGELPVWAYSPLYQKTEEKEKCEICGKIDFLIYTIEKSTKEIKIDFKSY